MAGLDDIPAAEVFDVVQGGDFGVVQIEGRGLDRIRGRVRKLCRGGGQEVAHSRDLPYPHGSSTSMRLPYLAVFQMLNRNGSVDMPRRNAPMEDVVLSAVNPSASR